MPKGELMHITNRHATVSHLIEHRELAVGHVRGHVAVRDRRHCLGEVCEFVEVRREEARRLELLCDVLVGFRLRVEGRG